MTEEYLNKLKDKLGYRANDEITLAFFAGIILLLLPHISFKVVGAISLLLGILSIILSKDHVAIYFDEDKLYYYDKEEYKPLSYEEIDTWNIEFTSMQVGNIVFLLKNGEMVNVVTYQTTKANQLLTKVLKDKDRSSKIIKNAEVSTSHMSLMDHIRFWFKKK